MWKEVNNNKNKHAQEMCLIKSSGPQTSVTIKSTETCLTVTLITANHVFISQCIQSMNKNYKSIWVSNDIKEITMMKTFTCKNRRTCTCNNLPKSTPSETFPRTTERRRAPRPFSHAYTINVHHSFIITNYN